MERNNIRAVVVITTLIILTIIAIAQGIAQKKEQNKVKEYPSTLIITSDDDIPDIIDFSKVILHDILGYNDITINIVINVKQSNEDAKIEKNLQHPHTYTLFLSKKVVYWANHKKIGVLAHEYAHVYQTESNRLQIIDEESVLWEGKIVNLENNRQYDQWKNLDLEKYAIILGNDIQNKVFKLSDCELLRN